MPVPLGDKARELVAIWNKRFQTAKRYREPFDRSCQATINAYLNKGPVSDPFAISVKTGRLMKDLETITPRDVRALLGDTPYFPYEANLPEHRLKARAITDLCERYTSQPSIRGDFYTAFTDALHQCRPFGKSYMWPHWDFWPVSIFQRMPEIDPVTGEVVGINEFRAIDIQEQLVWDVLAPWQVYVSPHGEHLNSKPWIIIQLRVHISELLPRLDRGQDEGGYDLVRDGKRIPWSELKEFSGGTDRQSAEAELRQDSAGEMSEFSDGVGTLLIGIESPTKENPSGRETHMFDYDTLLYNEDRSDWNMPLWQKPIVSLDHVVHIGPDKYYGIGLWQIIRDRVLLSEEAQSQFIDHVFRSSTGTMMFDKQRVPESMLARIIGGNIPITKNPNETFDSLIQPLDWGPAPDKLMEVSERMEQSIDESDGINDWMTGNSPPRKETARAVTTLSNASEVRVEHATAYIERTAMTQMAGMHPKIIDRHLTNHQRRLVLGEERARQLTSADPDMIPGGWSVRFMGSDRIRNLAQKLDGKLRALDVTGNMMPPGGVGHQYIAREVWEMAQVDPDTVDAIVDEIAGMFQQPPGGGPLESMSRGGQTVTGQQQGPSPGSEAAMRSFAAQGV